MEGGSAVVKVADSFSSSSKKDLKDSFVVTLADFSLLEVEVEHWLFSAFQVAVSAKRLSATLMWVTPLSMSDSQRLHFLPSVFVNGPLRWIDRSTEVLGPMVEPIWVRLEGIPLHAWAPEVFQLLGNCLGSVVQTDEAAISRTQLDAIPVKILRVASVRLPRFPPLIVEGLKFLILVSLVADQEVSAGLGQMESRGRMSPEKTLCWRIQISPLQPNSVGEDSFRCSQRI